ncbi:hypothetical protein HYQ46_006955 [Verticillium longisporum]|nr:hypothetical protein HYQ46_006955 [Verticillium longisporum]
MRARVGLERGIAGLDCWLDVGVVVVGARGPGVAVAGIENIKGLAFLCGNELAIDVGTELQEVLVGKRKGKLAMSRCVEGD